jgi:predicted glycosyltransferase involved in capsule biosynthesis
MKLAVIIPYRNRQENLNIFLDEFPKKINVTNYKIYIIEQVDEKPFNRAKLFNIGFDIIKDDVDYICFHDVDLIPEESDYSYTTIPLHLSKYCSQFNYKLYYKNIYGGVNLMSKENFLKINGFSNDFWGWGGEDDDLLKRVINADFKLERREGRYKSLDHKVSDKSNRFKNVKKLNSKYNYSMDGLSNLEYKILEKLELNNIAIKFKVMI